jgi:hypothetical protein
LELKIPNKNFERDGRLDVVISNNSKLLILETKTTLYDMLKDERFVEQYHKYQTELRKINKDFLYITLIGGRETDLLPQNHDACTSKSGDTAERLYTLMRKNNMRFISANALWAMYLKYISYGHKFSWDSFLYDYVFNDSNTIALLSFGKVVIDENSYTITPV